MSRKRIPLLRHASSGQALIEYALILVLVVFALAVALAATGPAISNVFSNTVYNLIGLSGTPIQTIEDKGGGPNSFWATVTWVAANPPGEVPFPTNPPQPPTTTPTDGPSPTPTEVTPSPTPSNTPTQPPTATPTDYALTAPYWDSVDTPERWRLDSSVWIGSDEWRGEYFPNFDLSGSPDFTLWNGQIDPAYKFNVNFDWGNNSPVTAPATWLDDNFSIRYTRHIYAPVDTQVRFTLSADDSARLRIQTPADGGTTSDIIGWTGGQSSVTTIPAGEHNLIVEFREGTATARVSLTMSNAGGVNPDDAAVPSGTAPECSWGRVDTSRSNTLQWMWDSDLINNDFQPGRRCYLEFRGSVDIAPLTTPKITFWDLWDLSAGGGIGTWFEIAEYNANRASMVWIPINLHAGPTTNYNWTRQTIDIPPQLVGKKIAFRFVMENNSNSTPARRWYIDDLEINNFDTNANLQICEDKTTCNTYWNLNDAAQKSQFIASGRWDLTNTNTQFSPGGTQMSWDDSPGDAYSNNWEGGPRIHSLELKGWVNLTNLPGSGVGGITDGDGDDGRPQISFWYAYDVDTNDRLELQWTRDAYNAGNGANWTTLTTLVPTAGARQTDLTMQFKEILLDGVPNWNAQPFRLRWALIVTDNNDSSAQGVYIDELYLEREAKPAFSPYPFFDDVENSNNLGWWRTEAQWARTNTSGVFGSTFSYTDSPLGNYPGGQDSAIQLRGAIDLNNNTPENISFYGGNLGYDGTQGTAENTASRPMLTFWHWRSVAANEIIAVEISNNNGTNWTTIWEWNYSTDSRSDDQFAWERVEINLEVALEQHTGLDWDTIATNPDLTDDDILVRFRLNTLSAPGSNDDGLYIDNISIANYSEETFKLWDTGFNASSGACGGSPTPPCGNGDGDLYVDDVDSPADWWNRWHTGGNWSAVDFTDAQRSGLYGFHDSPPSGSDYRHETYSVLEMKQIIDLRGTTSADQPTMYFWTRYRVGNNDLISVQISTENPGSTTQDYERVAGWDAWQRAETDDRFVTGTTPGTVGPYSSGIMLDTWTRVQVDLRNYAGERIRVRFVLDALDTSSNLEDGWFIDDVRFQLRNPRIFTLPFFDSAQNTQNWVVEGIWGLDAEKFRGSGGGPASLGPNPYFGYYFDCEFSGITCTGTSSYTTLLAQPDSAADLAVIPVVDVNYDFGTTGRPPGAPTDATGATWNDRYGARWEREITVAAGQYTFITVSDDGVRLRRNSGSCPAGSSSWNIINQWSTHARRVDMRNITLAAGDYCLTLEWFEHGGDAVIILTAGNNNFSFSDSPKLVAGSSAIMSVRNGNSALMLDGLLSLTGVTTPVLEFWTQYDLRQNTFARVEITQDGGFTWSFPSALGTNFSCDNTNFCNPTIGSSSSNRSNVAAGEWEIRRHNLASFINSNIGLRFRLQTSSWSQRDGWWFTDIQINQ